MRILSGTLGIIILCFLVSDSMAEEIQLPLL